METVYAMGFSRQKALENLNSLSLQISEHIFKLCLFPNRELPLPKERGFQ